MYTVQFETISDSILSCSTGFDNRPNFSLLVSRTRRFGVQLQRDQLLQTGRMICSHVWCFGNKTFTVGVEPWEYTQLQVFFSLTAFAQTVKTALEKQRCNIHNVSLMDLPPQIVTDMIRALADKMLG